MFTLPAQLRAAIQVDGAPRAVSSILTAYLEERDLDCAPQSPANRREVLNTVRDALDALGFFAAEAALEYRADDDCTLQIQLGKQAVITAWTLEFVDRDEDDGPMGEVRKLIKPAQTAFDPQVYNTIKQNVLTTLVDAGYVDARFAQAEVDVDIEQNTAQIVWRVDPGARAIVAPLLIEQTLLSRRLMEKFLDIAEGDYLVNDKLLSTYDNLVSSDYFSQVRVQPLLEQRNENKVPLRVSATAAEKWSYLAGPGFATDTGPRFRAEANARYLNPGGHRVSFSSLVSPVAGTVKGEYRWPYGNPNHEWYSLETRYNYEDTDTARSDIAAVGLKRSSRLTRRWTQTAYVDYSVEQFDISNQDGRSQLLMFGNNFTYTSTIDAARPRWGQRLSVDLRAGGRVLFSDNDVVQARVSAKQILPFLWRSRLLFRGEAGYSWQEDFADLPASLRFFVGGDKSVRGYALESLGTVDDTGRVIGGDRLLVGSVEIDVPVREQWSVALFTDTGSAFSDKPNFSQSFGVGLRWYSPLGPIRLDLAHPMQDSDQAVRIHISLGPDI